MSFITKQSMNPQIPLDHPDSFQGHKFVIMFNENQEVIGQLIFIVFLGIGFLLGDDSNI